VVGDVPSFVTVTYGASDESVTISALTADRAFIQSNPTTTISVTAIPEEMPSAELAQDIILTLRDSCDDTVLQTDIPLQAMITTVLRATPET